MKNLFDPLRNPRLSRVAERARDSAWRLTGAVAVAALASCGGGSGASTDRDTDLALSPSIQSVVDQVKPKQIYRWSDLKSGLPRTASEVSNVSEITIPAGILVIVDQSLLDLPNIRVEGTLVIADQDMELNAASLTITGRMQIGTPEQPFQHKVTITLTGARTNTDTTLINDGVARGLVVNGGELLMYGASPSPVWTQLNDHLAQGATAATLKENVNWHPGDTIAIAPTDFYGQSVTERTTLSAVAGQQITLASGLQSSRWGKLQYVTDSGMSLSPQANFVTPQPNTPTVLDERAEVANLTRNIVIQGADDSEWNTYGFGAHVMVMGLQSKTQIDGVEFRRVGQVGKLGRYPLHWHMLSYDASTGLELGDATNSFVRNSAIWNSSQRCIVLHSTNGVQVSNNVCHNIKGHAFFLEDATERRNLLQGNLALGVSLPTTPLKIHETNNSVGASGFWLTNPNNTVTDNRAVDAYGAGLWLAYPYNTLGISRTVPLVPRHLAPGVVARNTAHSNGSSGQLLGTAPVDDNVPNPELTMGTLSASAYAPMLGDQACSGDYCTYQMEFTVSGTQLYKNGITGNAGAYRNQAKKPIYEEWVTADNVGLHFAGSVEFGKLRRTLLIGNSLNVGKGYPSGSGVAPPAGLATYHSSVKITDNVLVNFPYSAGLTSGAFSTEDYYLRPVEKGTSYNTNNRLVNAHPGYHSVPNGLQPFPNPAQSWTLAGALWDPNGYWGPKNNYLVFNTPFFTEGLNCVSLDGATLGDGANTRSCAAEYIGVSTLQTEADASNSLIFRPAIQVQRQSNSGVPLGTFRVEDGYDTYTNPAVAAAYPCHAFITPPPGNYCAQMLGHMRHFVAVPQNRYVLTFPTAARPPRFVEFNVSNAYRVGDSVVFGVQFDGRYVVSGYNIAGSMWNREVGLLAPSTINGGSLTLQTLVFSRVASLDKIFTDTSGRKIYQDVANNMVWFKYVGGKYSAAMQANIAGSEESFYYHSSIVLAPQNVCAGAATRDECVARINALP